MKFKVLFIICILLLLTGCEEPTPKEKAQRTILYELNNCEGKFGGNDVPEKRVKNAEYCAKITNMVEDLIYAGWFDENDVNMERVNKEIETIENVEEVTVSDEITKLRTDIINTI